MTRRNPAPRRKLRPAGSHALEGLAGRLDGIDAEAAAMQAKLLTDIARLRLKELRAAPANPPPRKRV